MTKGSTVKSNVLVIVVGDGMLQLSLRMADEMLIEENDFTVSINSYFGSSPRSNRCFGSAPRRRILSPLSSRLLP